MFPTRTRVKVCGLTSAEDAASAVRAGADALGVIMADSPRQVDISTAEEVLAQVPPLIARVGVFVDASPEYVARAVERLGLSAVQFHGSETPEMCAATPVPVIKVFRVGTGFDVGEMEPYRATVAALLLDTYDPQRAGGTGKAFTWDAFAGVPGWAPVIVAGGLTPANVGGAIDALHPFAVDVSSGVEERPRYKDRLKLHAFVAAVRAADERTAR